MHLDQKKSLSNARYLHAQECLQAACLLLNSGNYKSAANRSYYAIFHAMRAVLAFDEIDMKHHGGIISEFRRLYIKTGIFSTQMSATISLLFNIRQDSDYDDFFVISKAEVVEQIDNAIAFLAEVKKFLDTKSNDTRMVYAAINEKGEEYYTNLKDVFNAINNKQLEYNWLITDCNCITNHPKIAQFENNKYGWITGEELTDIVTNDEFQWVFAVLSAFDKSVPLNEVLEYALPYADGYRGFWKKPLTMQHPLSKIEIVPWDGSLTLIYSVNEEIVNDFKKYYPHSQNLEEYIDGH